MQEQLEQKDLSGTSLPQSDNSSAVLESNREDVLSYFFIDSHPYHGVRTLEERVFGQGVSLSLLEYLKRFVFRDLLSVQKLDMVSRNAEASDARQRQHFSNMDNSTFSRQSKMTLLSEVGLALVTLFFKVSETHLGETFPRPQIHCAVTFVISSSKDSARLYFIFPVLRDRLMLTQQTVLTQLNAVDGNRRNKTGNVFTKSITSIISNNSSRSSNKTSTDESVDESVNVMLEWSRCIPKLAVDINGWLHAGVAWQQICPDDTLFPAILEGTTSNGNAGGGNTELVKEFPGLVTAALEHYCCIIRADETELVLRWLRTLSLFLQDSQLAMASPICARSIHNIVPNLTLQGTTCSTTAVLEILPLFSSPPVVLDVSRPLEESAHIFPTFTHLRFKEYRLAAMCGEKMDRFGSIRTRVTSRTVSPLVAAICSRVCCALRAKAPESPCGKTRNSSSLSCDGAPMSSALEVGSLDISQSTESVTPLHRGGLLAFLPHSLPSLDSLRNPPQETVLPLQLNATITSDNSISVSSINNCNHDIHHANVRNTLILLAHWRRQVELSALKLAVVERNTRVQAGNRRGSADVGSGISFPPASATGVHESDRRVLEVAISFFTPMREEKEKRERKAIWDSFTF